MTKDPSLATLVVSAGRPGGPGDPVNPALVLSSTYRAGGDRRYAREGTATWEAFEEAVGALEGGEAVSYSSGLAAIAACLELTPPGGLVAASRRLYVGSLQLLADLEESRRLRVAWFDEPGEEAVREADLVFVEDPTNPALVRVDITDVIARAQGRVVVDNTVATPLGRRPLALGASLVVHSATKYLGGHSDLLMGVVVAAERATAGRLRRHRTLHGATPGALEAFLALRGLRTLDVRMERAAAGAAELARRLADHPAVERATYPGLGSLVAFELVGGAPAADAMIDRLRLVVHATSLGGVESTIERRARWAEEGADVPDGLLRLSVGIEDVEDVWRDLQEALQ